MVRAVRAPHFRAVQAVWIVESLEAGLSAGAQAAFVDGTGRIAFEFDGPCFTGLHMQAATAGAFRTGTGIVGRDARDVVLVPNHVGDQLLDTIG